MEPGRESEGEGKRHGKGGEGKEVEGPDPQIFWPRAAPGGYLAGWRVARNNACGRATSERSVRRFQSAILTTTPTPRSTHRGHRQHASRPDMGVILAGSTTGTLFRSSAVLDPRVGHTMQDALSPFISFLCHSD